MMLPRMAGLGQPTPLVPIHEIPFLTGQEQLDWARSLVDPEFCKRLDCGYYTQSEVGLARQFACGLAYPGRPQSPCSALCEPYLEEYTAKWGPTCGTAPQVEHMPAATAAPETPEPSQVPTPAAPAIEPTLRPPPEPVYFGPPAPKRSPCCLIDLGGGCCITTDQAIGVGLVLVALMLRGRSN